MQYQRTVKNEIAATGVGAHSGENILISLKPAPVNTGVVFRRVDVNPAIEIPAQIKYVGDTLLGTTIKSGDYSISTIEHLLAAISALGIDNLYVDIDSVEVPIMDGSSAPFVFLLQSAGTLKQKELKRFMIIKKPIKVTSKDAYASLKPYNGFNLSFTISYEHPIFKSNSSIVDFEFSQVSFIKEISRARTYGFLSDYEKLTNMNLALGSSLNNAVVMDEFKVINEGGLRYTDEFVRHKILDSIGDLFLLGVRIIGKFEGYKSGHHLNNKLIDSLLQQPDSWEYVSFSSEESMPKAYAVAPY